VKDETVVNCDVRRVTTIGVVSFTLLKGGSLSLRKGGSVRLNRARAVLLKTIVAEVTGAAAVDTAANTNLVSNLEALDIASDSLDDTSNLVAGCNGVLVDAPFSIAVRVDIEKERSRLKNDEAGSCKQQGQRRMCSKY